MSRHRYSDAEQEFYRRYLASREWRVKKAARIEKAGHQCEFHTQKADGTKERCQRRTYLCVHHNTYERLGDERDSDLDVYCWLHHQLEHLLWQKCVCGKPCLDDDETATRWLTVMLYTLGIQLDKGPVAWTKLPNKEYFLDQVPVTCSSCMDLFP